MLHGFIWQSVTQVQAGSNDSAPALAADDDVDFTVVLDRRTGGTRAEGVRLIRRAADRRELGQVRKNLPFFVMSCLCPT